MSPRAEAMRSTPSGLLLAGATAVTSGISVLMNSYAVRDFPNAARYTTAKNFIAALLLVVLALALPALRARPSARPGGAPSPPTGRALASILGLAYIGIVGGGIAFICFFDGLAQTQAVTASFLHDTLVLWVALLCGSLLGERLRFANLAAIGALFVGEMVLGGGIGHLTANRGNALVLIATVCWAVETVIARRLLAAYSAARLALVRMGVGTLTLLGYLAATGGLAGLIGFDLHQLFWVALTGTLLAVYVATWMGALARARAVDVTSVLVVSVAITALAEGGLGRLAIGATAGLGIGLVLLGVLLAIAAWRQPATR